MHGKGLRPNKMYLGLFTAALALSCRTVKDDQSQTLAEAPRSTLQLNPGTEEALKVFPPLNEELPFDPAYESAEFATFGDMIHLMQKTLAKRDIHRGFHNKAHGCLAGNLYVLANPKVPEVYRQKFGPSFLEETRVGIFANPEAIDPNLAPEYSRQWPVLVRSSNAQGKSQTDAVPDGKGLAIKVLAAGGDAPGGFQDFTMSDTPICNGRTATEFMGLGFAVAGIYPPEKGGNAEGWAALNEKFKRRLPPLVKFLSEHPDPRHAVLENTFNFPKLHSVTEQQYWSRTPYRLGKRIVKFTALPVSCTADATLDSQETTAVRSGKFGKIRDRLAQTLRSIKTVGKKALGRTLELKDRLTDPDYYRHELAQKAQSSICWDFAYQFQTDPETTPVENAMVTWSPELSPPMVFARLVLPAQTFDDPEQILACEKLEWSPENFRSEHAPASNMNRARLAVYKASRLHRRIDGAVPPNPKDYPVKLIP